MIRKIIGSTGFILVYLGIGCVESPSMLLPVTMIVSGVVMIWAAAGLEENWTEK